MITRKYTNVSGSPEVDVRRTSPTINNTKIYPGTQVEFTETEWNALDEAQRRRIQSYADQGIFHEEISGAQAAPEPSGETTEEPAPPEEDETTADETSTDSATETEGATSEEATPDEEEPASEDKGGEEPAEDSDEEAIGEFDYAAFLDGSIADVKARYSAMESPPDLDELIAHEEAGDERKGMLEFFAEQKEG